MSEPNITPGSNWANGNGTAVTVVRVVKRGNVLYQMGGVSYSRPAADFLARYKPAKAAASKPEAKPE